MHDKMLIHENKLTAEEFCDLQEAVGFGRPSLTQIEIALKNSIYTVSWEVDGKIVGMGRLVGDGARIFYLQDIFIHPKYQGQGIGTEIVKRLLSYIENLQLENCSGPYQIMVGLMAANGKESFYERFGFKKRPNERQGSGMMLDIRK